MKVTCPDCEKVWRGLRTAHCTACHCTFTTPHAFDLHQTLRKGAVICRDPSSVGLVYVEYRAAFRFMTTDEENVDGV